MKTAEVTKLDT